MLGRLGQRIGRLLTDQLLSSLSGIPQELSQPFSLLGEKIVLGLPFFLSYRLKDFNAFQSEQC